MSTNNFFNEIVQHKEVISLVLWAVFSHEWNMCIFMGFTKALLRFNLRFNTIHWIYKCKGNPKPTFLLNPNYYIFNLIFESKFKFQKNSESNEIDTVRPRGTRPLGTRTSQIHGFDMGPKIFQIHGFTNVGHSFTSQLHGYELGPIIKPRYTVSRYTVYFLPS